MTTRKQLEAMLGVMAITLEAAYLMKYRIDNIAENLDVPVYHRTDKVYYTKLKDGLEKIQKALEYFEEDNLSSINITNDTGKIENKHDAWVKEAYLYARTACIVFNEQLKDKNHEESIIPEEFINSLQLNEKPRNN